MPTAAPVTSASAAPSGGAFTSDNCLFVEIVEERVLKSTSGGQTTSFAGEKTAYSYDSVAGTLAGAVEGTSAGDAMTIVGRTVVNQIDRTRVAAGRLYVLSADSRTFGPVAVQIPAPDGTVTVSIDGEMVTLSPGESISVDLEAAGEGETVSIGQAQRTVTVSNHGFLLRANLSAATP